MTCIEYDSSDSDAALRRTIFPDEKDDNAVMRDTRQWVQSVIAGMQVCPFTIDPDKAGIPLGIISFTSCFTFYFILLYGITQITKAACGIVCQEL